MERVVMITVVMGIERREEGEGRKKAKKKPP
jgi:hypothetical protein